jgi:hypothetical protein
MNNYSSMSAIVTALQSPLLARLKVTRNELKTKEDAMLQRLDKLLYSGNNFAAYRTALNATQGRCVPWLGESITFGRLPVEH